jgi:hypothetical protein
MKNSIWELINPNLNFFVSIILLDIVPFQPCCVQNYSIRCLSRDARLWGTLYLFFTMIYPNNGSRPNSQWPDVPQAVDAQSDPIRIDRWFHNPSHEYPEGIPVISKLYHSRNLLQGATIGAAGNEKGIARGDCGTGKTSSAIGE